MNRERETRGQAGVFGRLWPAALRLKDDRGVRCALCRESHDIWPEPVPFGDRNSPLSMVVVLFVLTLAGQPLLVPSIRVPAWARGARVGVILLDLAGAWRDSRRKHARYIAAQVLKRGLCPACAY